MAVRKDSALYNLLVKLGMGLDKSTKLISVDDAEIEDGELVIPYTYSAKDSYNGSMYKNSDSVGLTLFQPDADGGFCCGAMSIGEFPNFSVDIVIPQVVAAMKSYLMGTKMGLITATTYNQPGAEKLLKASGFESKPFYNPNTKHTCLSWQWRRTR